MESLLRSLAGEPTPDGPPTHRATSSPAASFIDWKLLEDTGTANLELSPEEQAIAQIAQGILERFNQVLDDSDDEECERSDTEEVEMGEPTVSGESMQSTVDNQVAKVSYFCTFTVDDGGPTADHPRKRARVHDPEVTSRQWYPWPDKIVSFIIHFGICSLLMYIHFLGLYT